MPYVTKQGNIAHGLGSVGAFLNNVQFDTGGGATWYNPHTIVYQHAVGATIYLGFYDIGSQALTQASDSGANFLYGSGSGHWAAWLAGTGLFSSVGVTLPDAGLLAMGPNGEIAYRPDYQGFGMRVVEIGGNDYWLSDGPAIDVSVVGEKQVIWQEDNALKTFGLPAAQVLEGGVWGPRACLISGKWWMAYYSGRFGTVIHPIDDCTQGYSPVTGDAFGFRITSLDSQPNVLRFVYSTTEGEGAGDVHFVDINVTTDPKVSFGPGTTVPGTGEGGGSGGGSDGTTIVVGTVLKSTGTFEVYGAAEELITLPIEIWPAFPAESGYGRLEHPTLGAFDYQVKPDEWVNIDADAIIPPVWSSTRTLTSAANVLWNGNLRDVVVEERWKALGGLAMPITQLRMLMAIWTTPIDPDVGYVHWYPNYITSVAFKVLPVSLQAGSGGITFDDIVNYKDEHGDNDGWVTNPVTFTMKLVGRL